jgi:hypothetical protein
MQTQCSRTMARFVGVMALLSLAVLPACQFKFSTANIATVTLSKDYKGGKAIDPTETFSPQNHTFHAVVKVNSAPAGTVVGAIWTILEDGEEVVHSKEIVLDGEQDFAHFTLSNPEDWESGTYRVEITLDGKAKRTIDFAVQ